LFLSGCAAVRAMESVKPLRRGSNRHKVPRERQNAIALPFIPLPFGVKIEVSWTTGSGVAVCIHFVTKNAATAITNADLVALTDAADTWRLGLRILQPATVAIAGIRATDWSSDTGGTSFQSPSVTVAGSDLQPALPQNVAMCVTHKTAKRGRSYRGRTYIPGLAEDVVATGDLLLAAKKTAALVAYSSFDLELLAAGFTRVVASFHTLGAARVIGVGTPVTVSSIDQYSDSQRRRLAGRGA